VRRRLAALALATLALAALATSQGCDATGRARVEIPLHGAGSEPGAFDVEGWSVELSRADVAFGPFWLCATESADPEFCDAALLELRETIALDALDPAPHMLATMPGITGTARSGMFDYGISWPATATRARANPGAPEERSAVFLGRATRGAVSFAFEARIEVVPIMQGALVVRGQRIAPHAIVSSDDALVVRVDPRAWWRRVDFDRLAARAVDPVILAPGDPDYEALIVAMTAGELPALEWGTE
jgi:hypothetical protein